MTIGVFDSGLGGLTVLLKIREKIPNLSVIILEITTMLHTAHGLTEIYDMTCKGIQVLFDRGCKLVIIACNTASAVALRKFKKSGYLQIGEC